MNYEQFNDEYEVDIQLLIETNRRKQLIRVMHQQFSISEEVSTYLVCFNNVKTAEDVLLLLTTQNGQMQHVFGGEADLCAICQYPKDQHVQDLVEKNEYEQVK